MLCDHLEGWDREERREKKRRGEESRAEQSRAEQSRAKKRTGQDILGQERTGQLSGWICWAGLWSSQQQSRAVQLKVTAILWRKCCHASLTLSYVVHTRSHTTVSLSSESCQSTWSVHVNDNQHVSYSVKVSNGCMMHVNHVNLVWQKLGLSFSDVNKLWWRLNLLNSMLRLRSFAKGWLRSYVKMHLHSVWRMLHFSSSDCNMELLFGG